MDVMKMDLIPEKLGELFNKYGSLKLLEQAKGYYIYMFSCDLKSLFDKNSIFYNFSDLINFALVHNAENECALFCFRAGNYAEQEEDMLRIINTINRKTEYGKYTIDKNGDIDWEYKFNADSTHPDDIEKILSSFFGSMTELVLLKMKSQAGQKDEGTNGQSES